MEDVKQSRPIFSHIRDLKGITDTIYGSTSGAPHYSKYPLGKHAGYYLQAHGYTHNSILEIEKVYFQTVDTNGSSNADKFVELLSPQGMATTEILWLWDLIRHDDDCGF